MVNQRKKPTIFRIALICTIIIIYLLSNQEGELSRSLSNYVARLLPIDFFDESSPSSIPFFIGLSIRNYAHVFLYAVLGIFVFLSLEDKRTIWLKALFAIGICYLCACMDEFHQLFILGRNARLIDTFFDALGFIPAIGLCGLFAMVRVKEASKNHQTR